MNVSSSKETILKKIRKALTQSTPLPFPGSEGNTSVYQPQKDELAVGFAEEFSRLLGKFVYCFDQAELQQQLQSLVMQQKWTTVFCGEDAIRQNLPPGVQKLFSENLESSDVSITSCECLISRTGTIVLSSSTQSGRTASVYAPVHICIGYSNQLVYDIRDGLQLLREKYDAHLPSMVTFATGPSRTADIEKTLVVGVHGPKEVYLFLVESPPPVS